jgi:hypothetical protein
MNRVYGFVLGLISVMMAGVAMSDSSTSRTSSLLNEWEFLCEKRQVDCDGIAPPDIVWMADPGFQGFYRPDLDPNVVFLNYFLDDIQTTLTYAHEASHYLDYKRGRLSYDNGYDLDELCISEAEAYGVSNAYAVYLGQPEAGFYDWIVAYPHCYLEIH